MYYVSGPHELHKCIIPKGTNYFVGRNGDVVSEKLLIFEKDCDFLEYLKNGTEVKSVISEINEKK